MPEQRIKFKPIHDFVTDLTSEVNDPGGHYSFLKLLRLTTSVMQELNLWVIPNLYTQRFVIQDNGTVDMPEDCIQPVIGFVVKKCGTEEFLFPLGKVDDRFARNITCSEFPEEPSVTDCNQVSLVNYYGRDQACWAWGAYSERYGKRESRFFGLYSFDSVENRVHFRNGPAPGYTVVLTFKSSNDDYKRLPVDAAPMVRHRVLQRYYIPTDKGAASMHRNEFRVSLKMFKKGRLSGYSLNDYIDAMTSEFTMAVGP